MKNAFGGLLNTQRHYTHSWIHETLVDLLAIQKEIHTGLFAVMDGTTAGQRPGAADDVSGGQERDAGVGRPGRDRRGGREDDGLRSDDHQYIRMAHEDGLGVGDPRDIEIVGDAKSRTRTGTSTSARTWCGSAAAT